MRKHFHFCFAFPAPYLELSPVIIVLMVYAIDHDQRKNIPPQAYEKKNHCTHPSNTRAYIPLLSASLSRFVLILAWSALFSDMFDSQPVYIIIIYLFYLSVFAFHIATHVRLRIMGGKITKSKTTIVLEKTNDSQKTLSTTAEATNDPIVEIISTITDEKQKTAKKTKKSKEDKASRKLSKVIKVDKSTNTANYILTSSPCTEQLVGGDEAPVLIPSISSETNTVQVNVAYQVETAHKDMSVLREDGHHNETMPLLCVREHCSSADGQAYPVVSLSNQDSLASSMDAHDQIER